MEPNTDSERQKAQKIKARERAKAHHEAHRDERNARARARYYVDIDESRARARRYAKTEARKAVALRFYARHSANVKSRVRAWHCTLGGRSRRLLSAAKCRAVACNVPFNLSLSEIERALLIAHDAGIVSLDSGRHDTASLDRIEPRRGYVSGNVQVIPWWLNAAYNRFPKDTVNKSIAEWVARIYIPTKRRRG